MILTRQHPADDQVTDLSITLEETDSDQLKRIVRGSLYDAIKRFAEKNSGYSTSSSRFPNTQAGEYYQLERKVGKLWAGIVAGDKQAFATEDAQEVLDDLIGHALLLKSLINTGGLER